MLSLSEKPHIGYIGFGGFLFYDCVAEGKEPEFVEIPECWGDEFVGAHGESS